MNEYLLKVVDPHPDKKWLLLVTCNRAQEFVPMVISSKTSATTTRKSSTYILRTKPPSTTTYMDMEILPNEAHFKIYLFFRKDKVWSIQHKKRVFLDVLNKNPKGIVIHKDEGFKIVVQPRRLHISANSTNTGTSSRYQNVNWKHNYVEAIRKAVGKKKYDKSLVTGSRNNRPIIYYDLNPFGDYPVVCMLMDDHSPKASNVHFWRRLLDVTKKIYGFHPKGWDGKVGWVSMFSLKTNLVDMYEAEPTRKDNKYFESWYTRKYDCDEAMMTYNAYRKFEACDVSTDSELSEIQKFAKSNYVVGVGLTQVTQSNFSGGEQKTLNTVMKTIYHWICPFFPRKWFEFLAKISSKEPSEDDMELDILTTDPTQLVYPLPSTLNLYSLFKKDRAMKSFKTESAFYKLLLAVYTTEYLGSHQVYGFACSTASGKTSGFGPKCRVYGIEWENLHQMKEGLSFDALPALETKFVEKCKRFSEKRMPTPLMVYDPVKKMHVKTFETNEDLDKMLRTVKFMLEKNGVPVLGTKESLPKDCRLSILSLHEMFDKDNCEATRREIFGHRKSIKAYECVEHSFGNFAFFLYIKL